MNRESELATLNSISQALNQAVDVRGAMQFALEKLLDVMGLETGWVFLKDEANQARWLGRGYSLAATQNLPPGLSLEEKKPWDGGCDCQGFCDTGKLTEAYNEVRCTRLQKASGDRRGLEVHASAPLKSGENVLGILNVAVPTWEAFSEESLSLLTTIGSQMGVALERARLYDLLHERRINEQLILLEVSSQLLRRLDLADLGRYFKEELLGTLDIDASALWVAREVEEGLSLIGAAGWRGESDSGAEPDLEGLSALIGEAVQEQSILNIESLSAAGLPAKRWAVFKNWGIEGLVILPLLAEERLIGAMMMARTKAWPLDPQEKRFYHLLANQLAIALEKARLHRQEIAQLQVEKELALSRQVQTSMLPQFVPELEGWGFAYSYRPAREVGGDFYDYFKLPPAADGTQEWGLVVADVADKGMPAAIFMALSRAMIRGAAFSALAPAAALRQANEAILREAGGALFLTAFYARLNPTSGHMRFSNAGHNRPLWVKSSGEMVEMATEGIILGVLDEVFLGEDEIQVSPGDSVVLYTDGIIEAVDQNEQLFGQKRLVQAIKSVAGSQPQQVVDAIMTAVEQFSRGVQQSDDVTVLVVRRNPK